MQALGKDFSQAPIRREGLIVNHRSSCSSDEVVVFLLLSTLCCQFFGLELQHRQNILELISRANVLSSLEFTITLVIIYSTYPVICIADYHNDKINDCENRNNQISNVIDS